MGNTDKVSILIVDDLPEKILVLESVLEELGENVVTARSGEQALGRVLEQEFAVILLDVNMPGMDGYETAQLIRRRKKSAHTPIIFITAYADELHTAQGYSLGAVDYILSPVVPEVLRTKVKVFVELARMTQLARRQADEQVALAREQAARAAAEETTRRLAFLAEASKVLASSLEPVETVRGLARTAVPFLAELAAVALEDGQRPPGHAEFVWKNPDALAGEHFSGLLTDAPAALFRAMERAAETGRGEELPGVTSVARPEGWNGAAVPWWIGGLGPALVLPLLGRGRTLGVMALARPPLARPYDRSERALAEELAGRAAIALDNARLHQNIQEGDRRKDEFLAMLAHELRNPLAPIRNAVEVLRRAGLDDPLLVQTRDMIDRQVSHMARLVDDLLDVSRLSRGKILLRKEMLDLRQLVESAAEDYRGTLEGNGLSLSVCVPDGPIPVLGDPTRLAQALGNILHNACKFTNAGGTVTVELDAAPGGDALVRVRDTGIGMERDVLARVFEAFSQADNSLDRSQGGLGLGLTLVKGLLELHGGKVSAASEGPGRGTEITLRLPRAEPTHAGLPPPAPRAAAPAPTHRVLIIEDNADAAESMRMLLNMYGHEVKVAHTGRAGLSAADKFRPTVVLCDLGLPGGMDGFAVARAFREDTDLRSVYLIAATGYGQAEDQLRSREAGFDAHLTKPVDFANLQDLLAFMPRSSGSSTVPAAALHSGTQNGAAVSS
jgi:signal transduction histidine kinase/DNA-binding response OmpR family regulator